MAGAHEVAVHEQPVRGALDVGEGAVVAVARVLVVGEADGLAGREQLGGAGAGLGPEALLAALGVAGLGGVDADEAHGPDPADADRVAVDHRLDDPVRGRSGTGGQRAGGRQGRATGDHQR